MLFSRRNPSFGYVTVWGIFVVEILLNTFNDIFYFLRCICLVNFARYIFMNSVLQRTKLPENVLDPPRRGNAPFLAPKMMKLHFLRFGLSLVVIPVKFLGNCGFTNAIIMRWKFRGCLNNQIINIIKYKNRQFRSFFLRRISLVHNILYESANIEDFKMWSTNFLRQSFRMLQYFMCI